MRSIRILGTGLLALFAIGALVASSANATVVLKLSTKGKGLLAAGSEVKASSSNLTFVTSAGNLECTENVLNGTLTNNSSAKDKAKVTSEKSSGKEAEGDCKTFDSARAHRHHSGRLPVDAGTDDQRRRIH